MKRYRRFGAKDYVILGLLALGILNRVIKTPSAFIIPILVFGIIFLLYKFPPERLAKGRFTRHRSKESRQNPSRQRERERRKAQFHVIYGNKTNSEEEPPKYH